MHIPSDPHTQQPTQPNTVTFFFHYAIVYIFLWSCIHINPQISGMTMLRFVTGEIFACILSLFMGVECLPTDEEVIVCDDKTTAEEV